MDGHPLVRLGMRRLLGDAYDVEEATTRREAVELVRDLGSFDAVVLNMQLTPGDLPGLEALRSLHRSEPSVRLIAYGARAERQLATQALQAGAGAFVSRTADPDQLKRAVDGVLEGERFIDPSVPPPGRRTKLTRRQRQLLQLLAEGKSTSFAARQLELSEETVKTHTKNILSRLGAQNRSHAIAIALRESLID